MKTYIDTNIFLRQLEGDKRSKYFLESVESGSKMFFVPAIVISEIVWVLESSYGRKKETVMGYLRVLLGMRNLKVANKYDVKKSIDLFGSSNVKYNDCVILAMMKDGDEIVSFDRDFDRFDWIKRVAPEDLLKK